MIKKHLLKVLFFLVFIKSLIWLFAVPIFQAPDEAVHFGYVQRLAEIGGRGDLRYDGIISKELISAGGIVNFNINIEHPVWRGYQVGWKDKILNIPEIQRKDFSLGGWPTGKLNFWGKEIIDNRGKKNPPLYYYLAASFYKLFYFKDFIFRFFAVRFFSVLLSLAVAFFAYNSAAIYFKKRCLALSVMALVSFQPMFSFMSVVANSDILGILLVTFFIFAGLKNIQTNDNRFVIWALISLFLLLLVKPVAAVLIICLLFLLNRKALFGIIYIFLFFAGLGFLVFLFDSLIYKSDILFSILEFIRYKIAYSDYKELSIFLIGSIVSGRIIPQFLIYISANKDTYINNLFPWYWGVFGWLETTMPLFVYRILKIITAISIFEIIWGFFKRNDLIRNNLRKLLFLISTIIVYSSAIIINDFKVFASTGIAFGIQGRYFLPVITASMIVMVLGLRILVSEKHESLLAVFLILGSIALNAIGFWTMYNYFYG